MTLLYKDFTLNNPASGNLTKTFDFHISGIIVSAGIKYAAALNAQTDLTCLIVPDVTNDFSDGPERVVFERKNKKDDAWVDIDDIAVSGKVKFTVKQGQAKGDIQVRLFWRSG